MRCFPVTQTVDKLHDSLHEAKPPQEFQKRLASNCGFSQSASHFGTVKSLLDSLLRVLQGSSTEDHKASRSKRQIALNKPTPISHHCRLRQEPTGFSHVGTKRKTVIRDSKYKKLIQYLHSPPPANRDRPPKDSEKAVVKKAHTVLRALERGWGLL